jgi:glutamate synthase (NADPH/NADH) small chain
VSPVRDMTKRPMPKQEPFERVRNFDEVALGYTAELAAEEAARCLSCKRPGCVDGCPVAVDIPAFIGSLVEDDPATGIRTIKQTNALPAVCGRVCPQEEQCEKSCVLGKKGEAVAIGRLERYLADWEAEQGAIEPPAPPPANGRRVAVVGSGPAGITVAADLALLGYEVTMFEALHEAGGVLTYGIPEFRLPKAIVRREVDYVRSLGVEVRLDFVVGKTRTIDRLFETHDAVFVGTGAGLPWFRPGTRPSSGQRGWRCSVAATSPWIRRGRRSASAPTRCTSCTGAGGRSCRPASRRSRTPRRRV